MPFTTIDEVSWTTAPYRDTKVLARHVTGLLIKTGSHLIKNYHVDLISDYDALSGHIQVMMTELEAPTIAPTEGPVWNDSTVRAFWIAGPNGTHLIWGVEEGDEAVSKEIYGALRSYREVGQLFELRILLRKNRWGDVRAQAEIRVPDDELARFVAEHPLSKHMAVRVKS
jgi:hypothetical protein